MPNVPTNKELYMKVKSLAKKKFQVWPSAYASSWLVRRYKKLGGEYIKTSSTKSTIMKFSTKKSSDLRKTGLSRWFEEEWIDVCQLPKIVSCGRKNSRKSKRKYPYCRPLYKISSKSPLLASSLSSDDIKKRCEQKRKSPNKKVLVH
jgi:hypothetical protein